MGKYDALRLDNQLCFRVYTASRNIVRKYAPYLDPLGLTYTQYLAMMVLWEQGETKVTGLCERLGLETSTVTPLLKKLEVAGFVTRSRSAADERVCVVSPTELGWELREKAVSVPACLASDLNVDMDLVERLVPLLDQLNASLLNAKD